MPIEFNCPSCFKGYRVADSNVGKKVKCKDCGAAMTVPDMSGLSFADEDTGRLRRPAKRHSSTKILPADRPKRTSATTSGPASSAPTKLNVPSDTVKLSSGARLMKPPGRTEPEPEPPKTVSKLPPGKLPGGLRTPGDLPKLKSTAGRTRVMPEAPKKRWPNVLLMLGCGAMIAGFFLPWFTPALDGFEPVAGFMLPLRAEAIVAALHAGGVYGDNAVVNAMHENTTALFTLFAVYLLPILALYAVIDDLRSAGRGKSHWWVRILAALGPVLAAGAVYFAFREAFDVSIAAGGIAIDQQATLNAIGPGAFTSAGGWLVMSLSIVLAPRVKKSKQAPPPAPAVDEDSDVPDVSSQLPKPRS